MARDQIASIQMLRGIAALMVAAFHLNAACIAEGGACGPYAAFARADVGVDIFFVISGFIIFVAAQRPGLTAGRFLVARFWRVVPPYWLALGLSIAAACALAVLAGDRSKIPTLESIAISASLMPYPDQVMAVAWTLTLEMMFYAVFAVSFFRGGAGAFFAAMGIWVGLSQIGMQGPLWHLTLNPLVIEFLFGALIARAWLDGWRLGAPAALAAGCAGLGLYLGGSTAHLPREVAAGLPAALLVYGLAVWRPKVPGWSVLLGEASYALYLGHLLIFSVSARGVEMLSDLNLYQGPLGLTLLLALAIAAAIWATVRLERPYLAWTRTRSKRLIPAR